MSDTIDTITLDGGKYTVELGHKNGRFSFTALRHGEPWRDMSSDGDNLMLAMFQQLRSQQEQIARLEQAARQPVQRTMQRWDVRDGSTPALEAEPTYTMTMDADKGLIEIRPAGIADDDLDGLPQLMVAVEISGGVPRAYVYNDVLDGEVLAEHIALPDGNLVGHLHAELDVKAIGELLRSRAAAASQSPDSSESDQAPRA
ncbi:hypothetical protein [Variovorax sp. JS1663]|uniref:hypothetical protein n=1 Tax=Variovorax sp. JS1663 TaxID=1851577 RepID=UPI000B341493|nr:hypothetical protein [Variovorax sp. JS1663]OUM00749.1 hypothetical protein A8M77_19885 [Variovorax sp. JS1663]